MNYEELVGKYIDLRDRKSAIKREYDEKVAKLDTVLDKIEAKLLEFFNDSGLESIRTESGTAYRTLRTTASVADRDMFLAYVLENDALELLETRAAKKAVEEFKNEHDGELPPGINWSAQAQVNVRRS